MMPVHQKASGAAKGRLCPKIAEWCAIVASPAPLWLTLWFILPLLWTIGPSKLSSIICRWDDEPYFIWIPVFIAVIRGKDLLPGLALRGQISFLYACQPGQTLDLCFYAIQWVCLWTIKKHPTIAKNLPRFRYMVKVCPRRFCCEWKGCRTYCI